MEEEKRLKCMEPQGSLWESVAEGRNTNILLLF